MDQATKNGFALLMNNVDPKILDMSNLTAQLKQGAEDRAKIDAINDAKRAERTGENKPANELTKLRRELWQLTERVKHTETYTLEQAGQLKLIETNITTMLKTKKQASDAGNEIGARNAEHAIQRLERAHSEATKEFQRARRQSAGAAVVLKEWQTVNGARLAELQKLVG